ncbi:ARG81-Transcription factor involved in arginine metabolism [Fusarium fujikuroi]|nr:ARG81-Transcription factor involved in arginine metabolism [Fusarium fujikuroi]SCV61103.1 ARG81-Transcription factor involved in arginine metabolism [Fusarium fujikuroi]
MDQGSLRKRRHKSFAGCWTCRARKVKCDETRPSCVQCSLKQLCCEGYEVRLRWMPLEAVSHGYRHDGNRRSEDDLEHGQQRFQRSLVICDEHAESPLQLSELDDIFSQIDSFQSQKDQSHHNQLFLSSFGVFDPSYTEKGYHEDGTLPFYATVPPSEDTLPSLSSNSFADSWEPDSSHEEYLPHASIPGFNLTGFGALLHAHEASAILTSDQESSAITLEASIQDNTAVILGDRPPESPATSVTTAPPDRFNYYTSTPQPSQQQDDRALWWKDTSNTIIHNPSPLPLPTLERFLLNHYVHRVVHLFCVISYEKSPWKTIHLPRVLQSAGQLSLHGSTTKVREALRNALLSISAFYLANDNRERGCENEGDRWEEDAVRFRGRAIKLLKETVEGSTPQSRPKYKELLATMLSQITINVMSGDTSTCGIHLDGAFRFMNHVKATKSTYSSKARSLHRIYFYLRVIYDSTACRNSCDYNDGSPPSPEADFSTALSVSLLDKVEDEGVGSGKSKSVLNHVTAPKAQQLGEYECVYGVPQALLILLARTTELIDQVTTSRQQQPNSPSTDFSDQCDQLESEIIDWEPASSSTSDLDTTPSALIIQKTTLAFHSALIIYFAQHIRHLHHNYLHTHILLVLSSIEAIEAIKSEKNIFSAPLYWPAFIAGSEAFEKGLQDRFRGWYRKVEGYRLASVRSGIDVLREVWKRGPGGGKGTSHWRRVVQETGVRLMLS